MAISSEHSWDYKPVISKFLPSNRERSQPFLTNLTKDKDTILKNGPLADRVLDKVWPKLNRHFRTHVKELHQDLVKLEKKYSEFRDISKSIMSSEMLFEMYEQYRIERRTPKTWKLLDFQTFMKSCGYKDNPWPQSSKFDFNVEGLDLSKGAGSPQMGPKSVQLNPARLYADKIKQDESTPAYMFLPGYRTQTEKTRGIWQDPISEWVLEVEAFRDAILKAVEQAKRANDIQLYYCTPEEMWRYIFKEGWQYAVVLDSKQFDASVFAWEIEDFLLYLARAYVAIRHIIDHAIRAPLEMPNGILERFGGLASGKLFTNLLDGGVNFRDILNAFEFISKYIKKWFINGDDIGFLCDTVVTEQNVRKAAKVSVRTLEPAKSWFSTNSVWFSKVFFCEPYFCKPAYLVLHSVIYRERDPLEGVLGKGYVAVATAQKCEWLRFHPWGEIIVKWIKVEDKYPIESLDDDIVNPALELYAKANPYLEQSGQLEELFKLPESSFYASVQA